MRYHYFHIDHIVAHSIAATGIGILLIAYLLCVLKIQATHDKPALRMVNSMLLLVSLLVNVGLGTIALSRVLYVHVYVFFLFLAVAIMLPLIACSLPASDRLCRASRRLGSTSSLIAAILCFLFVYDSSRVRYIVTHQYAYGDMARRTVHDLWILHAPETTNEYWTAASGLFVETPEYYKFVASRDALNSIVEGHFLKKIEVSDGLEVVSRFLKSPPKWWMPEQGRSASYYASDSGIFVINRNADILSFDEATQTYYFLRNR